MAKIKNSVLLAISIIIIILIGLNYKIIGQNIRTIYYRFINDPVVEIKEGNEYVIDEKFLFVRQVDDYTPSNYQDLLNIFYSVLNQGWEEFTFYCPNTYSDCLSDIQKISYDKELLSNINNFVHPYNSYSSLKTLYDENGVVTIEVTHLYSDNEIDTIDQEIDEILSSIVTDEMSLREKILAIHDYIIDNTKYDQSKALEDDDTYDSGRITGVLKNHYAICSGYADLMAVFLDKLGVTNYKISSDNHVWNAVYLDNTWYHLDLTWDDPVTNSGRDILEHNYFLIDTDTLHELDGNNTEHDFDLNVYLEFKED